MKITATVQAAFIISTAMPPNNRWSEHTDISTRTNNGAEAKSISSSSFLKRRYSSQLGV
jgi:hypothetical protein